jgi:amyloid beta precursor protein binding protein 1
MREEQLLLLDAACREYGVALIIARSYGLVGYVRISVAVRRHARTLCTQTPCRARCTHRTTLLTSARARPHVRQEHLIVESKPDNAPEDLRVAAPWPALAEFCDGFDLETCDDMAHHHVPYLVLLVRALAVWRGAHGGAVPATSAERTSFKDALRGMQRSYDEDNFKEAVAAAHKAWAPAGVPAEARAVLEDPAVAAAAAATTASTPEFWVLAAALVAFVGAEGGGALPLEGSIPDMTASTDAYVALQRLYAARAAADVEAVEAHAAAILRAAGRQPGAIPRDAVRLFCKNAAHLAVVRYSPLAQEVGVPGAAANSAALLAARGAALGRALAAEDAQRSNAVLYVLLRAADRFASQYGRFPGAYDSELEEDVSRLKAAAVGVLAEYGPSAAGTALPDDLVSEMCRFGAAELHCVAAVVGGIAAQEAIKLITHQFVPLGAPLIYNAIESTTSVLRLA